MSRKLLNVSRFILKNVKIARTLSTTSDARESGDENFKEKRRKSWTIGIGIGLSIGVGIGLAAWNNRKLEAAVPFDTDDQTYSGSSPRKRFNFIADVVAKCGPSVVYIEIKDTNTDTNNIFFGGHSTTSNGSGFIVQEDGLILTNAHVVVNKPRSSVSVKLQDGRVFLAKVEKIDMHSDLATLRIPVKNLPVMKLGTSADIRPGEWVVALGSPLTLSNTVTAGVVSSTTRNSDELGLHGKDMTYIQTDAAITFGNSGGPLVNLDGEAIGINSMKVASGISFAIPIDYAKRFLSSSSKSDPILVKKFLGITMLTLTPTIIRAIHQKTSQISQNVTFGVLVYRIVQGSPAHNSGLYLGDIITHFNGKEIHSAQDVYSILEKSTGPVTIRVHRDNRNFDIIVNPLEYTDYA